MCALSPNYPQPYGNNQACTIALVDGPGVPIKVIGFDTEEVYDTLTVNSVKYGGSVGPDGVVPTEDLKWRSDYSVAGNGWKLCPDW